MATTSALILNLDYYINSNGDLTFTEKYHLDRGYCCQNNCLHCPYGFKEKADPDIPAEFNDIWTDDYSEEEEEE